LWPLADCDSRCANSSNLNCPHISTAKREEILVTERLRYSGASLGFQIGAAISGGLTPFAAATFMAWTGGNTWPISIYLIVLAVITLIATVAAPETAGKRLQ
jgi:MHS family shikimate/dehydroshikimate transporter-like MFS transporter